MDVAGIMISNHQLINIKIENILTNRATLES